MTSKGIPSAKRVWTGVKLFAAVRDLPEVVPLIILLSGALGMAGYTACREYLTVASEQFPSKEMRNHMENQISYGQEKVPPHPLQRVAKWRRDKDGGLDVAVWPFSNRGFPGEHEIPTHRRAAQGVPAEGPYPTEW